MAEPSLSWYRCLSNSSSVCFSSAMTRNSALRSLNFIDRGRIGVSLWNLTVAHPCHDMNWVVRRVSLLAPKRSLRPCCLPVASMGLSMPPEQWHNRSLTPPTSARGHRTAPLMRLPQVFFPEFFQQFRKCHLYCQPSWR